MQNLSKEILTVLALSELICLCVISSWFRWEEDATI